MYLTPGSDASVHVTENLDVELSCQVESLGHRTKGCTVVELVSEEFKRWSQWCPGGNPMMNVYKYLSIIFEPVIIVKLRFKGVICWCNISLIGESKRFCKAGIYGKL